MHLIVDAQPLQTSSARRGIGRYATHLLQALTRVRPDWRIEAVVNAVLPSAALPAGVPIRRFTPPLPMHARTRGANQQYFGDWLAAAHPDAVLELSFFDEESLVPQFVTPRPPLAGVAYDLVPVLFHEQYLRHPAAHAIYRERFRQALGADLLLAISERTRQDVIRLMRLPPGRVATIGGAAGSFGNMRPVVNPAAVLERLGIDGPFLLYVGGTDPRKNLRGTLEAFAALPPPVRAAHLLVIVCALTPPQRAALEEAAASRGILRQLRLTGYAEDADLHALYEACRLSIFPSFYEGLGLPVLEALISGAPVVASDRSAIPEFTGGAARLTDPASTDDMAAAIVEVLAEPRADGEGRRRAAAAAFTWSDTATRAATAIEELVRLRAAPSGGRARIAWVSSVPPARTASSRYSALLLPLLRDRLEMELVVDSGCTVAPELAGGVRVLRPADVWSRHLEAPFDLFVYHVADAGHGRWMYDLMRWRSGLAVVHGTARGAEAGLLGACDAVVTHDRAQLASLRTMVPTAELVEPADAASMATWYAAAIERVLASRRERDGDWCDAASGALVDAGRAGEADDGLIEKWAALRVAARGAGPQAVPSSTDATESR